MSKRRRDRTPNLPTTAFNTPLAGPTMPAAANIAASAASPTARRAAVPVAVDWKTEYGEVLRDLGRTFIIFAGLVAVMFALSFVIR